MKRNGMKRAAAMLLLVLLLGGSFSARAFAVERGIDLDRSGSIRLSCFYDGKPVVGGDLRLYRVADVEMDENGNYSFRLLERFGGDKLGQAELDAPGLADRLANASGLKDLEYRSTEFDATGHAQFDSVKPGLYLLVQSKAAKGYQKMAPFLVSVPYFVSEETGYVYDVDAAVKPAVEREVKPTPTPGPTPPPHLPQTGQLNWPVPVLAGVGVLLLLLGTVLVVSDGPKKKTRR